MIKNKVKKGMILIYTDEFGNQKAIEPKDLIVKTDDVEISLGAFIKDTCVNVDSLKADRDKLRKEFDEFKEIQLKNTNDLLDTQIKQVDKLESLENDVKALLSINK